MRSVCVIVLLFTLHLCRAAEPVLGPEEIPFGFQDGFIWIDVCVNGSRACLHFLLDSGAQVSVLSEATARRLGLKGGRRVSVESVGGRTTGFWPRRLQARAGSISLPRDFLILNLQKLSDACTNAVVDGIIGADFFRDRIVQIDFRQRFVRVLRDPPVETGTEVLPLKVRRCGMLVSIQVNDAPVEWVRLDTGCASPLQWVSSSVPPERCTQRIAVALTQIPVPVTNTSVNLGGHRFEGVPTDIHTQPIFAGEKGLLGNGLLCQYNTVTLDPRRGKLFLR